MLGVSFWAAYGAATPKLIAGWVKGQNYGIALIHGIKPCGKRVVSGEGWDAVLVCRLQHLFRIFEEVDVIH